MKKNFVSQGTLDTIAQSRRARLNGRDEIFRELRHKTVCALRVDIGLLGALLIFPMDSVIDVLCQVYHFGPSLVSLKY